MSKPAPVDEPALFDVPAGARVEPRTPATPGEARNRRQAEQIATGYHPLCAVSTALRLLDLRARSATSPERADALGIKQRCGTCRFRSNVGGHSRGYPKCVFGAPTYRNGEPNTSRAPRVTSGAATDVRAWWPACTDYQPPTEGDTEQ